jgi:O-acetyl-ADP-ribose deacetylase (regulator of RNase III)
MKQRGSILVYGILALAILAMLGGIAYKIRESGKDAVRLEWREAVEAQKQQEQAQITQAGERKEKSDAKAKVVYRTITRDVEKVVTRDVYRNVCLDDSGLLLANAALAGPDATAGKPGKPLPQPDPAK